MMLEAGIISTRHFAIIKTEFNNKMYQYGLNSTFFFIEYCAGIPKYKISHSTIHTMILFSQLWSEEEGKRKHPDHLLGKCVRREHLGHPRESHQRVHQHPPDRGQSIHSQEHVVGDLQRCVVCGSGHRYGQKVVKEVSGEIWNLFLCFCSSHKVQLIS